MKRTGAVIAAVGLAMIAGVAGARAQTDLRVLREHNEILQAQDIARRDALAQQRELSAAQGRYEAQLRLRDLDDATKSRTEPVLVPTAPVPPRGPGPVDMAVEAERIDRLTAERLAQSNARIRAIETER